MPTTSDPGRFNPALRNRATILDKSRVDDLADEFGSQEDVMDFIVCLLDSLHAQSRDFGQALDREDLVLAREAAVTLAAEAAKTGARQLEHDVRLIEAALRAGRIERARKLRHRIDHDLVAVNEALPAILPGPGIQPDQ